MDLKDGAKKLGSPVSDTELNKDIGIVDPITNRVGLMSYV